MHRQSDPAARVGAYGLAVEGLDSERHLLVPAAANWPSVRISVDPPEAEDRTVLLTDCLARYPDRIGGHAVVDRNEGSVRFGGRRRPSSDELVHPRLGMLGAVYAQWLNRAAFHAGAFVAGGRAWAVVGERAHGKSTVIAALALAGLTVLGDDTLVLDGLDCLAGVRCVDLRGDAAAHLGCVQDAAPVRRGTRRRLRLGPAKRETPLGGWLYLAWADQLSVRPVPAAERVQRIARRRGWHRRGVSDPAQVLELASLPAWELRRPRDWSLIGETVDRVRDLTDR